MDRPSSTPWPIFAVVFAIIFVLAQFRPIHDVDIFWQVRLGQIVFDDGIPPHEPFAASHTEEPFVPVGWLAQAIFATVYRVGGWDGVHCFDSILWASAFALLAGSLRFQPLGAIAIAIGLGVIAALPWISVRPQTFAVLSFAAFLVLLRWRDGRWRRLCVAIPLLIFWQNCHPSVSLAALAAGVSAGVGWLFRREEIGQRWSTTMLVVVAIGATVATPAGLAIFRVSAANATISRELGIDEWRPLWAADNRASALPALAVLVIAVRLLLAHRRTINPADFTIAAVLLLATMMAIRFQVFWSIAVVLLVGANWPDAAMPIAPRFRRPLAGLAIVAVFLMISLRPKESFQHLPLDGASALEAAFAEEGMDRKGTVYNHPAWGGLLVFRDWPEWKVAYDGRYYIYTSDEWERQRRAALGDVPLADIEATEKPIAFFLHPLGEPGLIALLRASARWRIVHDDPRCVVFVPAPR